MAKKPIGKKATKAQMTVRVNTVFTMMLDAYSTRDIMAFAAENWKIGATQTKTLIRRATDIIIERGNVHRQFQLGKALARLERWLKQVIAAPPRHYGSTGMGGKTAAIRGVIHDISELSALLHVADSEGGLDMEALRKSLNENASAYPTDEAQQGAASPGEAPRDKAR